VLKLFWEALASSTSAWSASAQHKQNQSTNRQSGTHMLLVKLTGFQAEVEQLAFHGLFSPKVEITHALKCRSCFCENLASSTSARGTSAQHKQNQSTNCQSGTHMLLVELTSFQAEVEQLAFHGLFSLHRLCLMIL